MGLISWQTSISKVRAELSDKRKRKLVEKFIKKHGKIDHSIILNNVDVDYDTLLKILSELRNEGRLK